MVEEVAMSLEVGSSKQVSIPVVINNNGCEIVEIKRMLETLPDILPLVNGKVYRPDNREMEQILIEIRLLSSLGISQSAYYEHGVYYTNTLQDGDDGFVDYYVDTADDYLVDGDDMKNDALWVIDQNGHWLETGLQYSWEDYDDAHFYVFDGFTSEGTRFGAADPTHDYSIYLQKLSGAWRAYAIDQYDDSIAFYHTFTSSITPSYYETGIEVADWDEDAFGSYFSTNTQEMMAYDTVNGWKTIDYTHLNCTYGKGARVDPLENNQDDLNWGALHYN